MGGEHEMRNSGSTSDYIKERLSIDKEGDFTRAYLKKGFLTAAMEALFYARREAGLTQAQLADRLQTKHSSIARWEADTSGSISLHRYAEMALACGMIPLDIKLVPISSLSEYVTEDPQASRTADHYDAWLKKKLKPTFAVSSDIDAYDSNYNKTCEKFPKMKSYHFSGWTDFCQCSFQHVGMTISLEVPDVPLTHQEARGAVQFAEQLLKKQLTRQQTLLQGQIENVTTAASGSQVSHQSQAPGLSQTTA